MGGTPTDGTVTAVLAGRSEMEVTGAAVVATVDDGG
ncbi:MAG: hypothetical protein J07HX64_02327 [halophilic archaeon J07HX64]|nr:MAG: hypothetical protein J07HX64_02327 [halophilic archaeon J07HX64]